MVVFFYGRVSSFCGWVVDSIVVVLYGRVGAFYGLVVVSMVELWFL